MAQKGVDALFELPAEGEQSYPVDLDLFGAAPPPKARYAPGTRDGRTVRDWEVHEELAMWPVFRACTSWTAMVRAARLFLDVYGREARSRYKHPKIQQWQGAVFGVCRMRLVTRHLRGWESGPRVYEAAEWHFRSRRYHAPLTFGEARACLWPYANPDAGSARVPWERAMVFLDREAGGAWTEAANEDLFGGVSNITGLVRELPDGGPGDPARPERRDPLSELVVGFLNARPGLPSTRRLYDELCALAES